MIPAITHFIHSGSTTTPVVAGQSNHRLSTAGKLQSVNTPPYHKSRGSTISNIGKLGILFLFSFLLVFTPLQAKAGTWTSVGPDGGAWYVKATAISPNYGSDQTIFAGMWSGGGVFKSMNGGGSWSAVNTGLGNLNVTSLSISPNYASDQTIFAGTWSGGVFKSTNGGGSWGAVNAGLSNLWVYSLSLSPNYASDQTIFAGTYYGGGVYKSTNGGGSWSAVNTGLGNLNVYSLSLSPNYASDQTLFAGTYGGGVFKSTNGGGSWGAVNTGLSYLYMSSLSISPNYASDQTLFAAAGGGVFKSTNGGSSWGANIGTGYLHVESLSLSPNYASDQTLFAGTDGYGVFKSTNGGGSWSSVNTGLSYLHVKSLSLSPNYASDQTLFAGISFLGVFKSTNGGGSWGAVNTGFSCLVVYSLSLSPNYASDQTLFAGTYGHGVFKSTNGGGSWGAVNTGLVYLQVWSLSLSPNYASDQTLFAATYDGGVFKSTNGGGSWSAVNAGLRNLYVWSLSLSPNYASDQTLFAGTDGGVYKSTNGGGSWGAVNTGLSYLYVQSLSLSPNYASDQTLFAGTYGGGVFKSTNGGGSWGAVNTGLSYLYTSSLSLSPNYASDQTLFAGTYYGGVYKSTNGGGNWSAVNTGLGNLFVYSLSISPDYPYDGILFTGTYGSSVWKYADTVCSPLPEVCNGIDDDCDGLIDEGVENTYYRDEDGDTYGNAFAITQACSQPLGYASNSTDCDDNNVYIYPGATEVYNGLDDNCNTQIDEGVQPPVANNQSVTTAEDTAVAIMLTGGDPDGDPLIFSVIIQPSNGTLSGVASALIYSPNGNFNGLDSFSFKVNDGLADSNTATVSIMVSAVNDAPVVWDIPDISIDEDGSGTLPGNASLDSYVSDIETLDPFIIWTVIGGTNVTPIINSDRTVAFSATQNFNGQEILTFMATDTGDGTSGPLIASDTMVVTVTPMNDPPVLDPIGTKSVDENSLLTFTISGSDIEANLLTFSVAGLPPGANFDPDTRTFSWTPDYTQEGPHFVTFTVSDGTLEDSELVNIMVNNVNRLPVANAGTGETVHVDSVVTLDGSNSSDPDGDYPLTYSWSIISKPTGSTATLSEPAAVNPSFKADMVGDYEVKLVVTDNLGLSSLTDSVVINTSNTSPVADAGPDQAVIVRGTTVQLDGTQSYDLDGDTIYYSWTITQRPAGSTSVLSDPTSPTPTFVADVYGEYEIELVVYDSWAVSDPDSVSVSFTNVKPVANPGGNQSVIEGNTVFLNGSSSSDANGDPLTYNWSFVSIPGGSTTTLTSTTSVTTSFVTDMPGTYVVSLVVNDGFVNSDPANVTITVTSRQDEVIRILTESNNTINDLDPNVFMNRNMANALTNKINATLEMIDQGLYQDALDKLENDILGKTDGCVATGSPDRNDWIRDCEAQGQVYPLILQAIELLRGLI